MQSTNFLYNRILAYHEMSLWLPWVWRLVLVVVEANETFFVRLVDPYPVLSLGLLPIPFDNIISALQHSK